MANTRSAAKQPARKRTMSQDVNVRVPMVIGAGPVKTVLVMLWAHLGE
jgi:hypothetical protein